MPRMLWAGGQGWADDARVAVTAAEA
jgi:hypothetical protein